MTAKVPCGGCPESTSLELDARGTFEQRPFRLVGSVHVVSRAGGHWHEWRAALDGGGEAWLAEAAGAFFWMQEGALARWESARPGIRFADFVVVERGEASRVAIAGDVADAGSAAYRYVDLSGAHGAFATVDYGDEGDPGARTFVGRRVTLAEVGLEARGGTRSFVRVAGRDLSPKVAPGAKVTLDGIQLRVLGALARTGHESKRPKDVWHWEEFLLLGPSGLSWLVLADGRWSVATPIDAGDVHEDGAECVYADKKFARDGEALARIDAAVGEFPWEVRVAQEVATTDWRSTTKRASASLAREATDDEIAWSLLTPLDSDPTKRKD